MIGAASQAGRLTQQQRDDQLRERGIEVLTCLVKGTHSVQVDFTKGQLVRMLDPPRYSFNRFTLLNKGARAAVFA